MRYKYGKLEATRLTGVDFLPAYTTAKMGAPPASCMYGTRTPQAGWGVLGNDTEGDCTIAGVVHLDMLFDDITGTSSVIPSAAQTVAEYLSLTGGQDTGLNENFVLQTWMNQGLFGNKILAYAPVDYTDITALHQALYYYGHLYLGIQCPNSAQEQFSEGVPWTVVPGAQIDGGHCVIACGYDPTYVDIVTWGKRVRVTYPFLARYLEEAYVVIPSQYQQIGRGPALDLASLQSDLGALAV